MSLSVWACTHVLYAACVFSVSMHVLAGLSLCLLKGNECNLKKAVVWNHVRDFGEKKTD